MQETIFSLEKFNFVPNFIVFFRFFSAGGIKKSKKPVSALTIDANKAARLALATGVITKGQENSEWIDEVIKSH